MKKRCSGFKFTAGSRLAPLVFLFCALPACCGAADSGNSYICEDVKKPFFRALPLRDGRMEVRPGRAGAIDFSFRMPKPENTARVFIIGESAAGLLGGGQDGLRDYLEDIFHGREVEIHNFGMAAYESRRILDVYKEAMAYSPDLVIVLSGNNETGREYCGGFKAELEKRSTELRVLLAGLSLPREEAELRVSLGIHEARLAEMAALARGKTALVFCTLPANLRDFAPYGALPENLKRGVYALSSGAYEPALRGFRAALAAAPADPFAHFYSARALEALGRTGEAALAYGAALKYDAAGDRCSGDRNEMIRRAARAGGACLADLEAAFKAVSKNGLPGRGEIADGVHWHPDYNGFAGAVIAGAFAACPSAPPGAAARAPDPLKRKPRGPRSGDFAKVLSYACAYSAGDFFGGRYLPSERVLVMLDGLCSSDCARLKKAVFDPKALGRELRDSRWSPSLRKDLPAWRPHFLAAAAEMFRRRGLTADAGKALKASDSARLTPPGPAQAAAGREAARPLRQGEAESKTLSDEAVLRAEAGDLEAAKRLAAAASEKDPDNFAASMTACALAARTRDAAFGEEHCWDAVYSALNPPLHALRPGNPRFSAFRARGDFYLALGETERGCLDQRFAHEAAVDPREKRDVLETLEEKCGGVR